MSFKKLSLMVCCINNNKKTQKKKETTTNDDDNIKNPSKQNPQIPKQVSLQGRFSLADFSNPSSSVSLSDLSNSFLVDLYIFTFKDLELITQGFSKSNFIGEGGFGEVYKGFIDDKINPRLKAQPVAVKAMKQDRSQGHQEWLAEVILLGQLKHPHLVNLIGYCCEDEHRLLVYEYMERGNLENHLFKRYAGTLPWLTRIKIILGAAKGLAFLHEEARPVIYRDFKTSNILLNLEFSAKLSDFGLATDGPEGEESHITTCVMGTEGYAAPEYISTGHLTTMSDVYSFGVVLLELLTGRRAVDQSRLRKERDLVKWARPLLKDANKLEGIIDPRLEGQYSIQGAEKAAALAYQCLSHIPKSRPRMKTVVKTLEFMSGLTDIPLGPFVYVVTDEGVKVGDISHCVNDVKIVKQDGENENKEKKREIDWQRRGRGRKQRRKVKTSSRAVYSDTTLYKRLGTSLYPPLR